MFPLSYATEYYLVVACIGFISAISSERRVWKALVVSIVLFIFGVVLRLPWNDQYAGLLLFYFLAVAGLTYIGCLFWGWGMRKALSGSPFLSTSFASMPGICIAGYILYGQYVNPDCAESTVPVTLNDHTIRLPNSGVRWNYRENVLSLTGGEYLNYDPQTSKTYMADYCRMSKNGTVPVTVESVRLQVQNDTFDLIPSSADFPDRWFTTRDQIYVDGDHAEGAVCRSNFSGFSCAVWTTPVPSLKVSSFSGYSGSRDVDEVLVEQRSELSAWFDSLDFE